MVRRLAVLQWELRRRALASAAAGRASLLASLALIYADAAGRLDRDPFALRADRRAADALEESASAAEAELEEIENRLADARATGLRPRR